MTAQLRGWNAREKDNWRRLITNLFHKLSLDRICRRFSCVQMTTK